MLSTDTRQNLSPLLLRVVTGCGFITHGWGQIASGTESFEKLLALVGAPFAHAGGLIGPWVEVIGGFSLLAGAYVVVSAVALILIMVVAMVYVQAGYGFSSVKMIGLTPGGPMFGPPGYEINLLYIAGLVSLMLTGAGSISVDGVRKKSREKEKLRRRRR